jgi:hypothetical protein
VEPAAIASLAGAAGVVLGATLAVATAGPRAPVLGLGLALLAAPLALVPTLGSLASAFWVVAALLAAFLLLGGPPESKPTAAPVPLGGWPEAAFVVLGAAMTFAAGQASGDPGDAAALAAASACGLAAGILLLFATGVRRTAAGAILALVAVPLAATGLGVIVESSFAAALAVSLVVIAGAARALEPTGTPAGVEQVSRRRQG